MRAWQGRCQTNHRELIPETIHSTDRYANNGAERCCQVPDEMFGLVFSVSICINLTD